MKWVSILLVFINSFLYSQTGPNNPSSSGIDASVGSFTWNNTGNIFASDNSRSDATLNSNGDITYYLTSTNFGFSIPATDNIDGIVVEIERSDNGGGGNIKDNIVKIIKGGSISGTDKSGVGNWPSADAYKTYGSATDLWGLTWTAADINSNNFGIAISVNRTGGGTNNTGRIDHIRITIYHSASLPVDLLYFNGNQNNNSINVNWATSSEFNNDYFLLEKSKDGISFDVIGKINGAGNSNMFQEYNFIDNHSLVGINYYRLSQIDFNGNKETFNIIGIDYYSNIEVLIFPNPSIGKIKIQIDSEEEFNIVISDQLGRIKPIISISDNKKISLELYLPSGLYMVTISSLSYYSSEKFIIE